MASKFWFSSNEIELLDFRISELRNGVVYEGIYGVNIAKVQEIVRMPDSIVDMPASPPYVLGAFDLRGTVVPLIDLATWIGVKNTEVCVDDSKKRVIITSFSDVKVGFVAHETKLIRRVDCRDIKAAIFSSGTGDMDRGKFTGMTNVDGGLTLLMLDLESIVGDLDLSTKDDISKRLVDLCETSKFKGNVLVVDDSAVARTVVRRSLEQIGFGVLEAPDGQSGIDLLESLHKEHQSDVTKFLSLIISDIEMPVMNGYLFAEYVKHDKRFQLIPMIFNSSICDRYSEQKVREIGVNAYLVKFDADKFYHEVARAIQFQVD